MNIRLHALPCKIYCSKNQDAKLKELMHAVIN